MYLRFFVFVLAVITVAVIGCSGGSDPQGANPVEPEILSADLASVSVDGNRHLWGYYTLSFNEDGELEEVLPLRIAADHWNVLYWLEYSPCTDCFKVTSVVPTAESTIKVTISVKHPFASLNLTGFDVRGIAMGNGSQNFPAAGLVTPNKFLGQPELVNADGFTTLYNPTTIGAGPGGYQGYIQGIQSTVPYPNSTLNGYKRFASVEGAANRNYFLAGQTIEREFEIYKPAGSFIVGYAVDASWVPPTVIPPNDPVTAFSPEANCFEPWRIDYTVENIGDGFTPTGGSVLLKLDVYDYQGKFSHAVPTVECPALFPGVVFAAYKSSEADHAKFEVTIENQNCPAVSTYKALIKVEDIENDNAPDWLDLTAYQIVNLSIGMLEPENIQNFQVSDADPSLDDRIIRLTWDESDPGIEWYDIDRLDWNSGSETWEWNQVKSIAHPATSWMDSTPRYCGTTNPMEYRIRGRNSYGVSPDYSSDIGYPKTRTIGIALWCVANDDSGSGAVTSWTKVLNDYHDANTFWNQYGIEFVLDNTDGFLWVDNPSYKNVNNGQSVAMHDNYGNNQRPDDVNVYYVNLAEGSDSVAWCAVMCPANTHSTENIFIIMAKNVSNDLPIVLAHECGHAIGHFCDMYLLDSNGDMILNDGATCANTITWCPEAKLFCDINACYAQEPNAWPKTWNLMWYSAPDKPISKYDLYVTQQIYMSDWLVTHKSQYPFP